MDTSNLKSQIRSLFKKIDEQHIDAIIAIIKRKNIVITVQNIQKIYKYILKKYKEIEDIITPIIIKFKNDINDDSILDKEILDYIIEQVINDKLTTNEDDIIHTYLEIITTKETEKTLKYYPPLYIVDEDINIQSHDFIISRSLKFSNPRSILNDNIKRYLDLGCYSIFSNISSGESREDREERLRTNPNLIPQYEILSTIDQIKEFTYIDTEPTIFVGLPMFDLINVLGNGYCFLNCFYIFTTITYGASRLTKIYNGLSNFRQRFLNLRTQPSQEKSINNFIKGIKAHTHDYINRSRTYDDEIKSEFHAAINDDIPQTPLIMKQLVNIINCKIILLITDRNFEYVGDFELSCAEPDRINLDTEYCVIIQRNNEHYYLLLPQDNTKVNRKRLYDNYVGLCKKI